jgi:hypothetical protein
MWPQPAGATVHVAAHGRRDAALRGAFLPICAAGTPPADQHCIPTAAPNQGSRLVWNHQTGIIVVIAGRAVPDRRAATPADRGP